ncbi:MAG: dockerin type I repeat-containing protein, partial [Gemmatimonadota bacterium]|nr:dockerin type I repeat-containing protein [Gemmatimonadota bacterium]
DDLVEEGAFKMIDSKWHRPTDMLCACLAYLVERELGNENAEIYARAVITLWGNGLCLSNLGKGHFGCNAIAYDWIYDAMTPEERKKFGDYLGWWLNWSANTPEITVRYNHGSWLNTGSWGPAHLNTPNTGEGITARLLVALALSGAGTVYETACKSYLDSWNNRIPADCIPSFDRIGGVWAESIGHGGYGPVIVIPWAFEAWRTATGLDWFELGSPVSFLKEMNKWALHLNVPFNNLTAYIDDGGGGLLDNQWYITAPILGARYRDQVANYISTLDDRGGYWFFAPWLRFITYDPDLPARTPSEVGWPTARLFTGAGHIYMRSAWDNPDATWAFFGAGPAYALHSRDDEGHFLIAKKGWLAMRSGNGQHNNNDCYVGGSLAYNIVTIFDPDEQFRRIEPTSQYASTAIKNERDGGMIRYVYHGKHMDVKERGHIAAFKHEPRYTYAAGDLSQAYRTSKVSEVTRQFLYLRGEREFFLIFDRIDATNSDYPKHWFLHIPTEPTLTGTETVHTAGHVYSYTDTDYATWLSSDAGIEAEVLSTGRARAFLKTVLPAGATVTKRGGQGHDFWGHPCEPTAQYNHVNDNSGKPPLIPWRLEVEAPEGPTREYFLHVLEIGDEEDTEMSGVTLIERDTSEVGVRIVPQRGGEPLEVLFSRRGAMTARVKFGDEDGSFEPLPSEVDTTAAGLKGDINGDGKLAITDVICLLLRGLQNSDDASVDFNGDGHFTITDAIALLLYIREQPSITALASGL